METIILQEPLSSLSEDSSAYRESLREKTRVSFLPLYVGLCTAFVLPFGLGGVRSLLL